MKRFDGINGVAGVGDCLALGGIADQTFTGFCEGHDGRGGAFAFRVFQYHRFAAFHDGHAGVGGSEIDSNNFSHKIFKSLLAMLVPAVKCFVFG
jgi:hypothetical protein